MRGNLYTICTDPEYQNSVDTYTLDGLVDTEFDWYEEIEYPDYEIDEFLNYLKSFGFEITGDNCFRVTKTAKENYFKEQYQEFMKISKHMTLEKFSNSDLNYLRCNIEDKYSDAVYYDYFRTLDNFIRESEVGKNYYITEVYDMH